MSNTLTGEDLRKFLEVLHHQSFRGLTPGPTMKWCFKQEFSTYGLYDTHGDDLSRVVEIAHNMLEDEVLAEKVKESTRCLTCGHYREDHAQISAAGMTTQCVVGDEVFDRNNQHGGKGKPPCNCLKYMACAELGL